MKHLLLAGALVLVGVFSNQAQAEPCVIMANETSIAGGDETVTIQMDFTRAFCTSDRTPVGIVAPSETDAETTPVSKPATALSLTQSICATRAEGRALVSASSTSTSAFALANSDMDRVDSLVTINPTNLEVVGEPMSAVRNMSQKVLATIKCEFKK